MSPHIAGHLVPCDTSSVRLAEEAACGLLELGIPSCSQELAWSVWDIELVARMIAAQGLDKPLATTLAFLGTLLAAALARADSPAAAKVRDWCCRYERQVVRIVAAAAVVPRMSVVGTALDIHKVAPVSATVHARLGSKSRCMGFVAGSAFQDAASWSGSSGRSHCCRGIATWSGCDRRGRHWAYRRQEADSRWARHSCWVLPAKIQRETQMSGKSPVRGFESRDLTLLEIHRLEQRKSLGSSHARAS